MASLVFEGGLKDGFTFNMCDTVLAMLREVVVKPEDGRLVEQVTLEQRTYVKTTRRKVTKECGIAACVHCMPTTSRVLALKSVAAVEKRSRDAVKRTVKKEAAGG